ncbi:hypothetical protein TURU_093112 [Turdus rufiventris]|nr:hypothetical protein TURU_093112 [Turdus rufiventris]
MSRGEGDLASVDSQRDHYLQSKEDGAEDPAEDPDIFWDDFFQPALIRLNENFMQKRDQFRAFSQKMYNNINFSGKGSIEVAYSIKSKQLDFLVKISLTNNAKKRQGFNFGNDLVIESGKSAIEFVGLKLTPFIALVIEDKKRIWTEIGVLLYEAGEDLKGVIRASVDVVFNLLTHFSHLKTSSIL